VSSEQSLKLINNEDNFKALGIPFELLECLWVREANEIITAPPPPFTLNNTVEWINADVD
jgi:hypothetical protein